MQLHPTIIGIALAAAVMSACVKKTAPVTPQAARTIPSDAPFIEVEMPALVEPDRSTHGRR